MTIRLLVTPTAIKALDPCASRWAVYRAQFKGNKPHPLADLLTRPGVGDSRLCEDFLWLLRRLPNNPTLRTLGKRLWASWRASGDRYFLQATQWPGTSHRDYIFPIDLPADWKERALRVIEQMEAEQTPC